MQIVYRERGAEQELEVSIERPDATVADLAEALGVRRHDLAIDGRITPAEESLHHAGLTAGSVVGPPAAEPSTSARGMVVVRVVGGLVAGASVPLGPGSAVVGRHDRADVVIPHPAVSREHCRLEVSPAGEVSVTDLGSRNGTDVNGQRL
ncbi:MAG: FHA domain-containing protein, partial [Candidatus Dormibacteraeota bacterium]|nr:FHA domain-containing protein [Candidatus Dormibacteraeota bacterium]